jgi:hypothetical protein
MLSEPGVPVNSSLFTTMTDSFEMIAYEKNLLVDKLLNPGDLSYRTICASDNRSYAFSRYGLERSVLE